jgi:hypothetical protein
MLNYPDEWVFVYLNVGLGGPPIFYGLLVDQRRVDRAVGSGGFFLRLLLFLTATADIRSSGAGLNCASTESGPVSYVGVKPYTCNLH